ASGRGLTSSSAVDTPWRKAPSKLIRSKRLASRISHQSLHANPDSSASSICSKSPSTVEARTSFSFASTMCDRAPSAKTNASRRRDDDHLHPSIGLKLRLTHYLLLEPSAKCRPAFRQRLTAMQCERIVAPSSFSSVELPRHRKTGVPWNL